MHDLFVICSNCYTGIMCGSFLVKIDEYSSRIVYKTYSVRLVEYFEVDNHLSSNRLESE